MEHDLAPSLTRLARDQMLRVRHARGRCIVVFHGMAWVTQEGDLRDRLLIGGETFTLDRSGVVLIHALEPTSLVLLASDAVGATVAVAHQPVLPAVRRARMSRQHAYRRARRLRALALKRAWQRGVSLALRGWQMLSDTLAGRHAPSATRARPLHARASHAG